MTAPTLLLNVTCNLFWKIVLNFELKLFKNIFTLPLMATLILCEDDLFYNKRIGNGPSKDIHLVEI